MIDPRCTIVVPTHNRRDLLPRTLATLRTQSTPCEIVIADDGSTDGTAEWVASLADQHITLARDDRRRGVSQARNRGIRMARAAHVAFCDDDDLWAADKIATQLEAVATTGRRWSCTSAVHGTPELEVLHVHFAPTEEHVRRTIAHGNPIPGGCSSVLAERSLLEEVGGCDPDLSVLADWDLWIRLYEAAGPPAVVVDPLVFYVVHEGQMTRRLDGIRSELAHMRMKHADLGAPLPDSAVDTVDYWVVQMLRSSSRSGQALRHAVRSVTSSPGAARAWATALRSKLGGNRPMAAQAHHAHPGNIDSLVSGIKAQLEIAVADAPSDSAPGQPRLVELDLTDTASRRITEETRATSAFVAGDGPQGPASQPAPPSARPR